MSKKFEAFKAALESLCREHNVCLATTGYDQLAVFDLKDFDQPIYLDAIEDKTEQD